MSTSVWTDDRVAQLKELVELGMSTTQIAVEMNCGFTRNAIIGKMHRDGIESKNKRTGAPGRSVVCRTRVSTQVINNTKRRAESGNLVVKPPTPVCEEVFTPGPDGGVSLIDKHGDQCSWPLDNGNFCGSFPVVKGRSYCAHHCRISGRSPRELGEMEDRRKERQKQSRFKGYGY